MILNALSILDGFVSVLRIAVSLLVAGIGIQAWRVSGRANSTEQSTTLDGQYYLLFLLAFLLLALNVLSWPLLYLVLESYIAEWPQVMCIYGVTQVGHGSVGPARFLPMLIGLLQVTKPAVVFASGAWIVLHLVNSGTRAASLTRTVLVLLIVHGVLGAADALAESAYLALPKKEEFHSVGCCTVALERLDGSRFSPTAWLDESARRWLWASFYGLHAGMVAALIRWSLWRPRELSVKTLGILFVAAVFGACVFLAFLVEIAAPALLQLPEHRCVYDLLSRVPESNLVIALSVLGTYSIAWANIVAWCARCPESMLPGSQSIQRLLRIGLHGYLGSTVMLSVGLAVAR